MSKLSIPKPPHFSFQECLWFLNRSYDDCLYTLTSESVSKTIWMNGRIVLITISEEGNNLLINTNETVNETGTEAIITYVTAWFDMDRLLEPFYRKLSIHPQFGYMAGSFAGLRQMNIPDVFEALCWSIIGQQINLTFAYKIKRALVEKYGSYIEVDNKRYYTFPKPTVLAELDIEDLKALQFSRQKANYIINAAKVFNEGSLSKEMLLEMNTEDRLKALTALKGVGIWTANYVLMKSLNDTSGLPHGDVGLLKALEDHQLITNRKDQAAIIAIFKDFEGWESYLTHYLWRSLAVKD